MPPSTCRSDESNEGSSEDGGASRGGGGRGDAAAGKRMSQLQEQLDRLLDSHLLPKGVSPRFITGSHYAQAGLPEMLAYGASGGSMKQSSGGGGYGQHRRNKKGKKKKK
jgi:hypothetical protein